METYSEDNQRLLGSRRAYSQFPLRYCSRIASSEASHALFRAVFQWRAKRDSDQANPTYTQTPRTRIYLYIADDSDPLDDILKAELHEALMAAIEKLKPKQKELLRRIYENGETQEEIGESEGVSQQAIASRLRTIYNFLKKLLK